MERVLFSSASAARRLERARRHVASSLDAALDVVVLASRESAARALVRELAFARGSTARLEPSTLPRLARSLAEPALARRGVAIASPERLEALAREALASAPEGSRYARLHEHPSGASALVAALDELSASEDEGVTLAAIDPALRALAHAVDVRMEEARLASAAAVFRAAIEAIEGDPAGIAGVALLDVELASPLEARFARALLARTERAIVTVPGGDALASRALGASVSLDAIEEDDDVAPPSIELLMAASVEAECVELVRRALAALDRDDAPRLDEIAFVLADPATYRRPLARAIERARLSRAIEALSMEELGGRSFALALAPGLVEGSFPRRGRPNPLLGDEALAALRDHRPANRDRERRQVQLLAECAPELVLSYPKSDARGRASVPSRALSELGAIEPERAARPSAELAIDAREQDLVTLRELLEAPDRAAVRGQASHLTARSHALLRALRVRHQTNTSAWRGPDGAIARGGEELEAIRAIEGRPSSPSDEALEAFVVCPYRFFLAEVVGLAPSAAEGTNPEGVEAIRGAITDAIDASFEAAFFPRAPQPGACKTCAFLPICGPSAERDAARKAPDDRLRELTLLRRGR